MKILNMGSLNIDIVYEVDHIVRPGETIESNHLEYSVGGKGLNQSIALSRLSDDVYHMGYIGEDGLFLKEELQKQGVITDEIHQVSTRSGNAIIQVDQQGENSIILYHGANFEFEKEEIDKILKRFKKEVLVLQNEINQLDYILKKAKENDLMIILNPSPITKKLLEADLSMVDLFLLNETEAKDITKATTNEEIRKSCIEKFPNAQFVLTKGKAGSLFFDSEQVIEQKAYPVTAVDTTGAGDTFAGFFIATYLQTKDPKKALDIAAKASALSVMKKGAASSIPKKEEVLNFKEVAR